MVLVLQILALGCVQIIGQNLDVTQKGVKCLKRLEKTRMKAVAVETFGSWGPIGHKFITDIGRTIAGITKNPKSLALSI